MSNEAQNPASCQTVVSGSGFSAFRDSQIKTMANHCKEFSCELVTMLENIPENRPLYKDSGLWQVRTDDMEDVIFEQGVNESFFDFIKRVYDKENSFMVCFND